MRARTGDISEATGDIDEAAIAVFMAGLAAATPRAMTDYALGLTVLLRIAPDRPDLPVNAATLVEALRRLRLRLVEEA